MQTYFRLNPFVFGKRKDRADCEKGFSCYSGAGICSLVPSRGGNCSSSVTMCLWSRLSEKTIIHRFLVDCYRYFTWDCRMDAEHLPDSAQSLSAVEQRWGEKTMKAIRQDLYFLAIGCAVLDGILLVVAACLGLFSISLMVSVLVSSLFSLFHLVLLFSHLKKSLLKSPLGARRRAMENYLMRMGILAVFLSLGLTFFPFYALGIILPLLFPKLVLSIRLIIQKKES